MGDYIEMADRLLSGIAASLSGFLDPIARQLGIDGKTLVGLALVLLLFPVMILLRKIRERRSKSRNKY